MKWYIFLNSLCSRPFLKNVKNENSRNFVEIGYNVDLIILKHANTNMFRRGIKIKKSNYCHCNHRPSIAMYTEFRKNWTMFRFDP